MSYSLNIREKSKAAAKSAVAYEFDRKVIGEWKQEVHKCDRDHVVKLATGFIDTMDELAEDEDIVVSLSGSVGGLWNGGTITRLTNGGVSCQVGIVKREPNFTPATVSAPA